MRSVNSRRAGRGNVSALCRSSPRAVRRRSCPAGSALAGHRAALTGGQGPRTAALSLPRARGTFSLSERPAASGPSGWPNALGARGRRRVNSPLRGSFGGMVAIPETREHRCRADLTSGRIDPVRAGSCSATTPTVERGPCGGVGRLPASASARCSCLRCAPSRSTTDCLRRRGLTPAFQDTPLHFTTRPPSTAIVGDSTEGRPLPFHSIPHLGMPETGGSKATPDRQGAARAGNGTANLFSGIAPAVVGRADRPNATVLAHPSLRAWASALLHPPATSAFMFTLAPAPAPTRGFPRCRVPAASRLPRLPIRRPD